MRTGESGRDLRQDALAQANDLNDNRRNEHAMSNEIVERERLHHNERFSHDTDPRVDLNKWYAAIRHGSEWQASLLRQYAPNKDVLEYGCADGTLSIDVLNLAPQCGSYTGIDISDV